MKMIKVLLLLFVAGGLGGLTSGLLVWALGNGGITPATGFNMVPEFTLRWIGGRVFASGLWGIIFLIPIYINKAILKGAVLGILPWLSSILIIFPYRMHVGWFGLEMGYGTPIWTLFFGVVWGVTGTVFLSRFARR
ncbi:MAG: hypothetical protein KUG74_03055 [Rhodobacteraceae bacterium]|nr:hypothetical protein [Paracoccaceae bacterium]